MYGFSRKTKKRTADTKWVTPTIWLAPKLDQRVQILLPVQDEEDAGGLTQKYTLLKTIWAGLKPVSHNSYRRWQATSDLQNISHEFIIRVNAVQDLNVEFSSAFTVAFDQIEDIHPFKSDMFLMLESGSTVKGRMFRIRRIMNVDEKGEHLSILAEEMEELGTGANYPSDYIS